MHSEGRRKGFYLGRLARKLGKKRIGLLFFKQGKEKESRCAHEWSFRLQLSQIWCRTAQPNARQERHTHTNCACVLCLCFSFFLVTMSC